METVAQLIETFNGRKQIALIHKTGFRTLRVTYQELYDSVNKCAGMLHEKGLRKGDRVIIWGHNSPQWAIAFLASAYLGVVLVPIDYLATSTFVKKIAQATKPKIIFHSEYKLIPLNIEKISLESIDSKIHDFKPLKGKLEGEDLLEIVYTSGTTSEPKGVMLTHKNVISNVNAVTQFVKVESNQTFLSVLPLSHLFEQNPGFLAPLSQGCTIVYVKSLKPALLFKTLADERITNMVVVPRVLKLFSDSIMREAQAKKIKWLVNLLMNTPILSKKILLYPVHSKIGLHFKYFICGGATLPVELENLWSKLGFKIIQGYGLTECSPVLTANPLNNIVKGSVGISLPGIEVKITGGQILARGENITQGYYKNTEKTKEIFDGDWLKTGDLGHFKENQLYINGRAKDIIITSAGVNVYPKDIESELMKNPKVSDCCVLGIQTAQGEMVHAEIITQYDINSIIKKANENLNESQKILSFSKWKKSDFPRTTTLKIKKREVLAAIKPGHVEESKTDVSKLHEIISQAAGINPSKIKENSKLSDLKLTSIGRVELVSYMEQAYNMDIEEERISAETTVAEIEKIIKERVKNKRIFKRWLLSWPIRLIRLTYTLIIQDNALRIFVHAKIKGKENLKGLNEPAIFISNHIGYFDAPTIYMALPIRIRNRIAAAAFKEYFDIPKSQILKKLLFTFYFWYASLFANIYLFPKKSGFKKSLEYTGELLDRGWNVLFFPEGEHSKDGKLQSFRTGIGLLVKEMNVPIVPIKLTGLHKIMSGDDHQMPRIGKATISFGKPVRINSDQPIVEIAKELHDLIDKM